MVCGDIRLSGMPARNAWRLDQFPENIWRDILVPGGGSRIPRNGVPRAKGVLFRAYSARASRALLRPAETKRSFAPLAHDPEHAFGGSDFAIFSPINSETAGRRRRVPEHRAIAGLADCRFPAQEAPRPVFRASLENARPRWAVDSQSRVVGDFAELQEMPVVMGAMPSSRRWLAGFARRLNSGQIRWQISCRGGNDPGPAPPEPEGNSDGSLR